MKELLGILVAKRLSVIAVLLAIFVGMLVTYLLGRFKNRFIKFIPAFVLIIVGTVFLADGWTNILTSRGINSLYYAMIIGTSGVVSLFDALLLMNFKRK